MRQAEDAGQELYRETDKPGAAIKVALVQLDKDVGRRFGIIAHFANEESLSRPYRLEQDFGRGGDFAKPQAEVVAARFR